MGLRRITTAVLLSASLLTSTFALPAAQARTLTAGFKMCATAVLSKAAATAINKGQRRASAVEAAKVQRCINTAYSDLSTMQHWLFCDAAGWGFVYSKRDGCIKRDMLTVASTTDWRKGTNTRVPDIFKVVALSNWDEFAQDEYGGQITRVIRTAGSQGMTEGGFINAIHNTNWYAENAWHARSALIFKYFDPATYRYHLESIAYTLRRNATQQGVAMTDSELAAAAEQFAWSEYEWHIEDSDLLTG